MKEIVIIQLEKFLEKNKITSKQNKFDVFNKFIKTTNNQITTSDAKVLLEIISKYEASRNIAGIKNDGSEIFKEVC